MSAARRVLRRPARYLQAIPLAAIQSVGSEQEFSEALAARTRKFGSSGSARCKNCGAQCLPDLEHRVHFAPTVRIACVDHALQGVHITFTCRRCFGATAAN